MYYQFTQPEIRFSEAKPFHHLHTTPIEDDVLFTDEKDFILVNNMIAISALRAGCKILAFAIMSNHLHFILEGGGPEIRAKTYRVYHKRSFKNVIDTAIDWLSDSLNLLGCTPSIPSIGIGRTHYEANALLLKSVAYGNLTNQSGTERYVNSRLNDTGIGPLGFGGKTTVLGSYVNVGNQRASGVRIVSVRPSCFVEPRVATLKL